MSEPTTEADALWLKEARRSAYRWSQGERCTSCGEWVGHWGGGGTDAFGEPRPPCHRIPEGVLLSELRPNCYDVRRQRMADRIRHAT